MTFDLDAFIAEVERTPFVFTFGGEEFTWPGGIDVRMTTLLAEGKLDEALRVLNGEQHARFMQAWAGHNGVLDNEVIRGLFGAHASHVGSSLGESSASTGSSKSTERPSKPTSKRTIK